MGMMGTLTDKALAGITRLYRVEPKNLGDKGEWLKKHLSPKQYDEFISKRGRLFADNTEVLGNYGWGAKDNNSFYVDVPTGIAQKIGTKHPDGFIEYVVPDEFLSKKKIADNLKSVGLPITGLGLMGAASAISPERANAEALQEPTFDPTALLSPGGMMSNIGGEGISALLKYFTGGK
jgi:hypothetical protein